MNFRSDNTASCAAEILAAIAAANDKPAAPYGEDPWSRQLNGAFASLFERDVAVFVVATGTAANSVSLASLAPPWGAIYCHREAHIERDEAGAPEFYTGGAKLVLVDGVNAKLEAGALEQAVRLGKRDEHAVKPAAISISQATERGAAYRAEEIAAIGRVAREHGLGLHMDGARFANAVAALGCAPADLAWRSGVDILSFGATKNGALGAEAIVCFDLDRAEEIARRRKRGGHLLSKSRYAAAQLLAYLENDLWLRLARRANDMAQELAEAAAPLLSSPVETNQLFIKPGPAGLQKLRAAGADFYEWGEQGSGEARLVVSWNQSEADIAAMRALLTSLAR